MVLEYLPSDALSQHLLSYLGFCYLGRGVSLQKTSQSDHKTTALSNSVKLSPAVWGHPGWSGHGGEV